MKETKNMFSGFGAAVQQREQEQQKISAVVMGTTVPKSKTTITVSITKEDKAKVKQYALANNTTVSDLLHDWIEQNCV